MKKLKAILFTLIFVSAVSVGMTGCTGESKSSESPETVSSAAESVSGTDASAKTLSNLTGQSEYFDETDLLTDYSDVTADIVLNDDSTKITGSGAEYKDGVISITKGGTYVLTGKLSDGRMYVNCDEFVHIVLNGAEINSSTYSPLYVEKSGGVVITLADGSSNKLSDGTEYKYENGEENEPDAVIFSKDDLSLNGGGSLEITANYNEGITTKDDLRIAECSLDITSAGNAIKGKDSVAVLDADIKINSQQDGIKSSNSDNADKGYIVFESGNFDITAAYDAVQAENTLEINGGEFNLTSGTLNTSASSDNKNPDNSSADNGGNSTGNNGFGGFGGGMTQEGNQNKTEESKKGLKAGNCITINDGVITAVCEDDSVHSNGNIDINSGTLILSSGDGGIHSDETLTINGGNIDIKTSYEGIEGKVINVENGNISVMSSDDGFNASDGSGSSMQPGGFGDVSFDCELNINGGYIYVNASGDGIDSNGVLNINGGTVIVDGPVSGGDGALDSGSEIVVTGGILVAAGSSQMAELPSDNSTQYSLSLGFAQTQTSSVCVKDSDGNVILSFQPSKEYSSVVISTPEIKSGSEYSVYYGGTSGGDRKNGFISGGSYTGGELLGTLTAESPVTSVGDGTVGQMGGGGMPGGGDKPSDMPEMPDGNSSEGGNMTPPGGMTPPDNNGNGNAPQGGIPQNGNFGGNSNDNSSV